MASTVAGSVAASGGLAGCAFFVAPPPKAAEDASDAAAVEDGAVDGEGHTDGASATPDGTTNGPDQSSGDLGAATPDTSAGGPADSTQTTADL